MINQIDTTAYLLLGICEEILSVLNHKKDTDDIIEIVKECIAKNKEQANLKGFWIDRLTECKPKEFGIEFHFKHVDDSYKIWFSNTGTSYGIYQATAVCPYIIITQPLKPKIDGLMYCSPHQRILYVDYFTEWVPLDDEDKSLSVKELLECCRSDIDSTKKECFSSFYKRLSEGEKEELSIANIDFWNLDDKEGDNYNYLVSRIRDDAISCLVTSDRQTLTQLKSVLPDGIVYSLYNEPLLLLSKRQWVFRVVTQIKDIIRTESDGLRIMKKWFTALTRHYSIPQSMLSDVLRELMDEDMFFMRNCGYL